MQCSHAVKTHQSRLALDRSVNRLFVTLLPHLGGHVQYVRGICVECLVASLAPPISRNSSSCSDSLSHFPSLPFLLPRRSICSLPPAHHRLLLTASVLHLFCVYMRAFWHGA